MKKQEFMMKAINLANDNVLKNKGGPFGAIVVLNGKIIGVGQNEVTANNDPTAHAEIQAIRAACNYLNDYQLTDCEVFTSCEPCPMCLGAIYWARPKAVYYAAKKEDAAKVGFDDQFIYEEINLPIDNRKIKMKRIKAKDYNIPFENWHHLSNKKEY